MPTERFYRLPDAKKQLIREAAVKEFARVPFEKASINQIIQNAGISRGSFYTYFADKQDLLEFLFSDSFIQMQQFCENKLKETDGDYFAMLEYLFQFMVERLQDTKDMLEVARNVFSYQENAKMIWKPNMHSSEDGFLPKQDLPYLWVYDRIDVSRMNVENAEDIRPLMALGMMALMINVKQYYENPDMLEEIQEQFKKMMTLIKYGIYKR